MGEPVKTAAGWVDKIGGRVFYGAMGWLVLLAALMAARWLISPKRRLRDIS